MSGRFVLLDHVIHGILHRSPEQLRACGQLQKEASIHGSESIPLSSARSISEYGWRMKPRDSDHPLEMNASAASDTECSQD